MKFLFTILIITFVGSTRAQPKMMSPEKRMITIPAAIYDPFFIKTSPEPIRVATFKLDETAVTNQEYLEFVKANPQWRISKVNRLFADSNYLKHWEGDLSIGKARENIYNSPVVHVSWFAAQAYAKWKNKRLPTVEEWENAGKAAPRNTKYSNINDYIREWYSLPSPKVLPNIKSTYQNTFGLYDMHGLIWEWTFNFNSFISTGDSRGNTQDEITAFCAGGTINVKDKNDYAGYLRFSYRGSLKGNFCIANLGFRCAQDIK